VKPRVVEHLLSGIPFLLGANHVSNQILGLPGDDFPFGTIEIVNPFFNGKHDFPVIGPPKGRVAREKDEENHSRGPNIAELVVTALQHFWGDIVTRSCFCLHLLFSPCGLFPNASGRFSRGLLGLLVLLLDLVLVLE